MSNERFSAKVNLYLTSTPRFCRHRLPPSESSITVFPGSNIKISNVLKISPGLCAVPLGLRYQRIGSSINFSGFFSSKRNVSGWAQTVVDESLPVTAQSAHSCFSKGRPCLPVMIIII